jgi:diguanylate cyclase (GGDEF)-like protein/PAS domain S-box-containing protein
MTQVEALKQPVRLLSKWLILIAALLVLGCTIGYSQYRDYIQIESLEHDRLTGQTKVIERNLIPQIFSTDHAIVGILESLPAWYLERNGLELANKRLQIISDTLAGIQNILIIDANGQVLASNERELIGRDLSKRDYFQIALKSNNTQTLYVTPPFTTVLNTFVICLYRVIPGPDGKFGGIVIATVNPKHIQTLLDSVRYAQDTTASLIHGDGKLFMMMPERPDLNGKDLSLPGTLFARHQKSGLPVSMFAELVYVTGEEQMVAFRTIRPANFFMDKPLVVSVSRKLEAIYAPWLRASAMAGGMYGVLVLGAILSMVFYQRRQRLLARIVIHHEHERHLAEQTLKASEARLNAIFDASPDPLLISTAQGMITMTNQQVERLLGFTAGELIGQPIERLVPARFRMAHPTLRAEFAGAKAAQRMGDGLATKAMRKDGSECDVEISLSRIQTDQGVFFACALRNITERKQAEVALRIAATTFEAQEAMIVTDHNCVILRINQAFTESTGYTPEEAVGQTPRLLKSGRHDADFYRVMWETIIRTGGWHGEIWDRRKNGEIYPKSLAISSVKGVDGAVTHYVGTHQDITESKIAEEKIKQLAFFDVVTHLPNRTLLIDRLKHAITVSARGESCGALLFIDLDHFKTLNDTLGHDKGDLLLQQVAQRLVASVRESDTVARVGGDEFVVVLGGLNKSPQEAANQTDAVGETIRASLGRMYQLGDAEYRSTASIGATLFTGLQTSIDDLLKQADLAMYKAKEAGRNALRFFDPAMQTVIVERAALETGLRKAIDGNQLILHYQAQVASDGRVTGAEALVRWQHPERGMVSPAEFIPLAEETGQILPLGRWALESACTQLAAWATRPKMADLEMSVNVSAHEFRQSDFVDQVLAVLKNTGANPRRLKLELTESMLVDNIQEIVEKMFALKAKGVHFSLDDFGTGYSSLSYLKRLPLDQLKIDQSFVRDVLIDPNDAAIAKTIVALAQSLGLGVIAEGVETEAQRDFLTSIGCHAYQGYFFSRPLPLAGFEEFVLKVERAHGEPEIRLTLLQKTAQHGTSQPATDNNKQATFENSIC